MTNAYGKLKKLDQTLSEKEITEEVRHRLIGLKESENARVLTLISAQNDIFSLLLSHISNITDKTTSIPYPTHRHLLAVTMSLSAALEGAARGEWTHNTSESVQSVKHDIAATLISIACSRSPRQRAAVHRATRALVSSSASPFTALPMPPTIPSKDLVATQKVQAYCYSTHVHCMLTHASFDADTLLSTVKSPTWLTSGNPDEIWEGRDQTPVPGLERTLLSLREISQPASCVQAPQIEAHTLLNVVTSVTDVVSCLLESVRRWQHVFRYLESEEGDAEDVEVEMEDGDASTTAVLSERDEWNIVSWASITRLIGVGFQCIQWALRVMPEPSFESISPHLFSLLAPALVTSHPDTGRVTRLETEALAAQLSATPGITDDALGLMASKTLSLLSDSSVCKGRRSGSLPQVITGLAHGMARGGKTPVVRAMFDSLLEKAREPGFPQITALHSVRELLQDRLTVPGAVRGSGPDAGHAEALGRYSAACALTVLLDLRGDEDYGLRNAINRAAASALLRMGCASKRHSTTLNAVSEQYPQLLGACHRALAAGGQAAIIACQFLSLLSTARLSTGNKYASTASALMGALGSSSVFIRKQAAHAFPVVAGTGVPALEALVSAMQEASPASPSLNLLHGVLYCARVLIRKPGRFTPGRVRPPLAVGDVLPLHVDDEAGFVAVLDTLLDVGRLRMCPSLVVGEATTLCEEITSHVDVESIHSRCQAVIGYPWLEHGPKWCPN
eukprot:gnl/Dysnectes_brevis/5237_a7442_505.p1 GENE.gnl/Dysnectes_brevis/5237_a7442_505~~gnl/Dysnectes_brevis/5237_a7442_505.p1  ORF type:complete len:819 (+),score=124.11 gnl/Dysnectes_brevis/5237_a7442_505:253-2457(+)